MFIETRLPEHSTFEDRKLITVPWGHGLHVTSLLLKNIGAGIWGDWDVGSRDWCRTQVTHLILKQVVILIRPKVLSVLTAKRTMQYRLNTLKYYKTAHGDQGEHNVFTGLGFADRGSPSCWVVPQKLPPWGQEDVCGRVWVGDGKAG